MENILTSLYDMMRLFEQVIAMGAGSVITIVLIFVTKRWL